MKTALMTRIALIALAPLLLSTSALTDGFTSGGGGGSNTNAATLCAGTTTYLDGEANCDDISGVYEDELDNSAGLLGALSDETGTGVAVFGTAPTFTTSITMGSATLNEAELEILDGLTATTAELEFMDGVASQVIDDDRIDTAAELDAIVTDENLLVETEIDASSELLAIMDDETGSGLLVFGTAPTIGAPVLTLPDAAGGAPTIDGVIEYDRTSERIEVGDGATTQEFHPGPHTNEIGTSTAFVVESTPSVAAQATGTDAISIGEGAISGDASGDASTIAIGESSRAIGARAIAIGENTDSTGIASIAIGGHPTDSASADASGTNAIAMAADSDATGISAIALGLSSNATEDYTIAFGELTTASGNNAFALGLSAVASATNSVAVGQNTDATARECIAIGGNGTDGDSADCSAVDSVAIGQHVIADDIGEFAFASGEFAAQSDAHTSIFVLRNNTTDGTQTELFADGSAGDISVPSDCTNLARISIVARQTDEDGTSAMYLIVVGHSNDAGTTTELAAPTVTTIFEDSNATGWDVDTTADDTNDGINVLVTGAASDAVQWVARAEVVETCG